MSEICPPHSFHCSADAENLPTANDVQFSLSFSFWSTVTHDFASLGRFCTDFFPPCFPVPPRGFSQHLKALESRGPGSEFPPNKIRTFNVCLCCKPAFSHLRHCPSFHQLCALIAKLCLRMKFCSQSLLTRIRADAVSLPR